MDPDAPSSPDQDKAPVDHSAGTEEKSSRGGDTVESTSPSGNSGQSGLSQFWSELKRRKVVRVAVTYAIVGWLIIQVANATFGEFGIPLWAYRFVVLMLVLGFPIALIIAWAFELTPDGIKTTKSAQAAQEHSQLSAQQQKKRNWMAYATGAVLPTIIFGVLALFFYFRSDAPSPSLGESESGKSIAVLPFADMSEEGGNEYFSDGISEELLNVLAKIPNLRVPARTSSFFFKGKNMPVREIGQALNVDYILEGSVRTAGDQVRITAQLAKASDGYHIWSDTFTRDLKDIFALQDEIAGLIADQLQLELGITTEARPVDPEAHRLLLEATHYYNQRGMDNLDRAIQLLERVLEIDPNFAEAHVAMARVWGRRATYLNIDYGTDISAEVANQRASARRALELDPALVDAVVETASSFDLEGRMEESGKWFQKAQTLNPKYLMSSGSYAAFLMHSGEFIASLRVYEKSLNNDPLDFGKHWAAGMRATNLGKFEYALRLLDRADSLRPGGYIPARAISGFVLWELGQQSRAIEIARSVRQSWPTDPRATSDIFALWILVQAGLEDEVSEYSEMLFAELPPQSFKRGFVLTALGRFEEAIPYLEHATTSYLDDFASGNMFDPYREDPRFKELLETLDWTEEYKTARADIEKAKSIDL